MSCVGQPANLWLPHNQEVIMAIAAKAAPELQEAVRDMSYMLADNARAIEHHDHGEGTATLARMRKASKTLTTGVTATVGFTTVDYLCGCIAADPAAGTFTSQVSGVFHVTGRLHFDAGPVGLRQVELVYIDSHGFSVVPDVARDEPTATLSDTLGIDTDLYIESGGVIRLDARQVSGGNLAIIDSYQNHFSAHLVSSCVGTTYCVGSGCP